MFLYSFLSIGTRQAKKVQTGAKKTFWQRLCGKSEEDIKKQADQDLEGNFHNVLTDLEIYF